MTATFGPVIFHPDGTEDFSAKCISGQYYCRGYIGGQCFWNGEAKKIPTDNATPDWCQYKESALRDARDMADD